MFEYVRFRTIIIGICFVLFAIPSYIIIPSFITVEMNKLTGGGSLSPMSYQILSSLGIPPIDTIVVLVQYSFVGLMVAGLGIIAFGAIAKNIPKQTAVKMKIESNQRAYEKEDSNLEVLHLLKERLAKGEITSNQYQDLRKVLEDKV
jgi:uncharacterized membrane protein